MVLLLLLQAHLSQTTTTTTTTRRRRRRQQQGLDGRGRLPVREEEGQVSHRKLSSLAQA